MRALATALCGALLAGSAIGAPSLSLPIDCELGETCFLQNYVDTDPGPGYSDFTCGPLSYDGHKGTDFAVRSLADMQSGVNVLASAAGVVVGTRDGMADRAITNDTVASVEGRECGNGVAIDHGDGWVTQYCHMKQGSVSVSKGQTVETGAVLGQVGLSGRTQFPHVHISVRHNGTVIDPFQPGAGQTCGTSEKTLWADPLAYSPGGLITLGFTTAIPSFDQVKSGQIAQSTLPSNAPALVLYAYGFGSRAGDRLDITIHGPSNRVVAQSIDLDKTQAQYFRAIGKRVPAAGWQPGTYTGTVTLYRDQIPIDSQSLTLTIE